MLVEVKQESFTASGYKDELVWEATWLFFATGSHTFLDHATTNFAAAADDETTTDKGIFYWNNKLAANAVSLVNMFHVAFIVFNFYIWCRHRVKKISCYICFCRFCLLDFVSFVILDLPMKKHWDYPPTWLISSSVHIFQSKTSIEHLVKHFQWITISCIFLFFFFCKANGLILITNEPHKIISYFQHGIQVPFLRLGTYMDGCFLLSLHHFDFL